MALGRWFDTATLKGWTTVLQDQPMTDADILTWLRENCQISVYHPEAGIVEHMPWRGYDRWDDLMRLVTRSIPQADGDDPDCVPIA